MYRVIHQVPGANSHWVVFAGIRGDGRAENTTLRIYDPLPQGRGAVYSVNYATLVRNLPAATYQLFQRLMRRRAYLFIFLIDIDTSGKV